VTSWTVFAVNPKVPAATLPELVAYSKSHPGGVRYGSGGTGGVLHIAVEMLKLKSGGNFVHVPYRGGARPRPMRSRARSRWCRWGLPRPALPKVDS
jgi:tripartite-type tricarboxylate transporter receptor subunit TctC